MVRLCYHQCTGCDGATRTPTFHLRIYLSHWWWSSLLELEKDICYCFIKYQGWIYRSGSHCERGFMDTSSSWRNRSPSIPSYHHLLRQPITRHIVERRTSPCTHHQTYRYSFSLHPWDRRFNLVCLLLNTGGGLTYQVLLRKLITSHPALVYARLEGECKSNKFTRNRQVKGAEANLVLFVTVALHSLL